MNPPTPSRIALYQERTGERPLGPDDLWRPPVVGAPVPAPDGSYLVVPVREHDIHNEDHESLTRLWRVSTQPDGPDPTPLTGPAVDAKQPAISPDGQTLAFVRKPPEGKPQLHLMPLGGGEAERVTDLPLGVSGPRWLPDGSGIVFGSQLIRGHLTVEATAAELERREKDPVRVRASEDRVYRFWDEWLTDGEILHLFLYRVEDRSSRDLMPESELWFPFMAATPSFDIAPDGQEVAFTCAYLTGEFEELRSAAFRLPLTGGTPQRLTKPHAASDGSPRYTPDGAAIVYGRREDPYFYADGQRLMRYDRATGEHHPWLVDWDRAPEEWRFGTDGALYFRAHEAGRTDLFRFDGEGEPRALIVTGAVSNVTPGPEGRIYFCHQRFSRPPEVAFCTADGSAAERLTDFTGPALEKIAFGEVRDVRFEGADGAPLQMFLVFPPGYDATRRYPLLQVLHGGPHGMHTDVFHRRWNPHTLAADEYVVALVNFQGSIGFGADFAKRIQGAMGDLPPRDILAATDLLVEEGIADPDRLAAAGGSYGGYLACWLVTQTDRFKCVVNHAGVFDHLAQYGSDVTQGRHVRYGGTAWDGIEHVDSHSPSRHVASVVTPMLITHGENDFRVPVGQAYQCYGVLKAMGVPARLLVFPDENHWISKPHNSARWYREVLDWFARHLGTGGRLMLVLVDGHNAMYALNLWAGSHRDSRMRLLERVKSVQPKAVVYFDAQDGPTDLVSIGGEAGMRVVYCSRREADAEMVERISNAVHPSQVLVVTNDAQLRRHVKRLGARVTEIRPFLDRKPEEVDDKAGAPTMLYRAEDFDLPDEIDLDAPPDGLV